MKYITRTVWILSAVSLFTDAASEMLYPVMPVYLRSIGFSIVLIGILEGVAEATAGISKGYFGKLSDRSGKRIPFVQLGYALSAISKPMMSVVANPLWIFFARTTDRLGKGIRTGARDAILSDEATPLTKGKVFGFHRSMDTVGAVIGPAFALIWLHYNPEHYTALFYLAFIPGCVAMAASFLLKDKNRQVVTAEKPVPFFSFFHYWKQSTPAYRRVVAGLLAFTLFNSSDLFLLLRAKQIGLNDTQVIGLYIFYNLIYALSAFPLGMLADKIGFKKTFMTGLCIFAVVYFGMGITGNIFFIGTLFFLYGLYAAASEGISKAWISNICDKEDTATAIGTYSGFQSICTMIASSLAGFIWYKFGASVTFFITGAFSVIIIFYFLTIKVAKAEPSRQQAT